MVGFLQMDSPPIPSMNKVTISFWFRVPSEVGNSLTIPSSNWDFAVLLKVVPLLMFGKQQMVTVYEPGGGQIGELPNAPFPPIPIFGEFFVGSHTGPMEPSCIGVQFYDPGTGPDGDDTPSLHVNIQTKDLPKGENLAVETKDIVILHPGDPGYSAGYPYAVVNTDGTFGVTSYPEWFGNSAQDFSSLDQLGPRVKPDQWHHMLISWDLTGGSATHGAGADEDWTYASVTTAFSKMWIAVDDKNYSGEDLPAMWVQGGDPNAMLSSTAYKYAGSKGTVEGTIPAKDLATAVPQQASVSVTFSDIPTSPIWIPAPPQLERSTTSSGTPGPLDASQKVEMAELQIFTGLALDTSVENNRRAFLDKSEKKDSDGNVISSEWIPANPSKAKELMGKEPEIMLHGSSNWKSGTNTGSVGFITDQDDNKKKNPAGQFAHHDKIKQYKPDPKISSAAA